MKTNKRLYVIAAAFLGLFVFNGAVGAYSAAVVPLEDAINRAETILIVKVESITDSALPQEGIEQSFIAYKTLYSFKGDISSGTIIVNKRADNAFDGPPSCFRADNNYLVYLKNGKLATEECPAEFDAQSVAALHVKAMPGDVEDAVIEANLRRVETLTTGAFGALKQLSHSSRYAYLSGNSPEKIRLIQACKAILKKHGVDKSPAFGDDLFIAQNILSKRLQDEEVFKTKFKDAKKAFDGRAYSFAKILFNDLLRRDPGNDEASEYLRKIKTEEKNLARKSGVVLPDESDIPSCRNRLKASSGMLRLLAKEASWEVLQSRECLDLALASLKDPDQHLREAAVVSVSNVIGNHPDWGLGERAVPVLLESLDDQDPYVRSVAIVALGSAFHNGVHSGPALEILYSRLQSDKENKPAILRALGAAKDPRVLDMLISAMDSGNRDLRYNAVDVLGGYDDPRIPPIFIKLKDDPDTSLSYAAKDYLSGRNIAGANKAESLAAFLTEAENNERKKYWSGAVVSYSRYLAGCAAGLSCDKMNFLKRAACYMRMGLCSDAKADIESAKTPPWRSVSVEEYEVAYSWTCEKDPQKAKKQIKDLIKKGWCHGACYKPELIQEFIKGLDEDPEYKTMMRDYGEYTGAIKEYQARIGPVEVSSGVPAKRVCDFGTATEWCDVRDRALSRKDTKCESWTIIPDLCAGPISVFSTEADIVAAFGESNVERKDIGYGEGETLPGLVLFPKDEEKRLRIAWRDDTRQRISFMRVQGNKTLWHTRQGVTIGTTLKELEALNAKPFSMLGFAFDGSGTVSSWGGGKLFLEYGTFGTPIPCVLTVQMSETGEGRLSQEEFSELLGDNEFSSSLPELQRLNPHVQELIVNWN